MPLPETDDLSLGLVHEGWNHLRLQRPIAAWASWQRALRIDTGNRAAAEAIEVLTSADELPLAARASYRFRSPLGDDRRTRWSETFAGRDLQDLAIAADVFEILRESDPSDSAAIFNCALCLAWQGRNREAIAAIGQSVAIDAADRPDDAVASWMLAEVLRQGGGAEDDADDVSYAVAYDWDESRGDALTVLSRMAILRVFPTPLDPKTGLPSEDGVRAGEWLEEEDAIARVLAAVIVLPGRIRFSSPDLIGLQRAAGIWQDALADLDLEPEWSSTPLPIRLMDSAVWLFRLAEEWSEDERRAEVETYFEKRWVLIPRHGLDFDGEPRSPAEIAFLIAGGDLVLTAKLAAIVQFREQLAARTSRLALYVGYPFDRLRKRLGLPLNQPESVDPEDVSCMSFSELESLDPQSLSDTSLADAIESAIGFASPSTMTKLQEERGRRQGDSRHE